MKKTIFIVGPTASGKTAVSVALATRLGTSVVSADSRQCYHGLRIGTAWPSNAELDAVKHYFIDAFPVTREITAADYEKLALGYLSEIFTNHDCAVVCGGTGLYIKALSEGLDEMPDVDPAINREVNEQYKLSGLTWLQAAVRAEDPLFFVDGEIQNPARLIRALVFVRSVGKSITQYRSFSPKKRDFDSIKVGLELPRELLYERINNRVDQMVKDGLVEEAGSFHHLRHLKNLSTVGYAELFDFFDGTCSLPEAIEKIKQHTRNYAKRQLTWFKRDTGITWLDPREPEIIGKIMDIIAANGRSM